MTKITIRLMPDEAWNAVKDIYQAGMDTKNATFEINAPEWEIWDKTHRKDCRLIAESDEKVIGWAALSKVSERAVYSGVAEVSVYIDKDFCGRGIGNKLLERLITESEKLNIWTLQAGIFPENIASLKVHFRNGFRVVGKRERIGKMDENWRDVLLLERRSKVTGFL